MISPPSPPKVNSDELADSCLLSFIAGYVDTCVFVGLFGLFTAHVTGNLVLIGSELVHQSSDVLSKILALPVFVVAVAATVKAVEALQRAGRPRVAPLIYAEAGLLLACVVVALAFKAPDSPSDPAALAAGFLATAAMGVQNAMTRLEFSSRPTTTVMTGNVTQVAIDAVTMLGRRVDPATDAQKKVEARQRFTRMWPPIVVFTVGAAGGAGGYAAVGLSALIVPAILCIAVGWHFSRIRRI